VSWYGTTGCRAQAMVAKLQELGVPIEWAQVARIAGEGSVGRPHIATALVELGVVPTVSDAFTPEWIADGGRAHITKHELDPFKAIRLVKAAGGVTVFAHPLAVKRGNTVPEAAIADLAAYGLDGIEVDHMDHDEATRAHLRGLAADLGLLATGSSDYHGSRKTCRLGEYTTDPEIYGEITRRATGAFPVPGTGGRRA
jgi:3',5'-nucleoside bisphosphate phosphatase